MATTETLVFSKSNITNYALTLSEDADKIIMDCHGAKNIGIEVKGITSDEIKVYTSLFDDESDISEQVFNEVGTNPFNANGSHQIKHANLTKLKIQRTGATDGVINVAITFQR